MAYPDDDDEDAVPGQPGTDEEGEFAVPSMAIGYPGATTGYQPQAYPSISGAPPAPITQAVGGNYGSGLVPYAAAMANPPNVPGDHPSIASSPATQPQPSSPLSDADAAWIADSLKGAPKPRLSVGQEIGRGLVRSVGVPALELEEAGTRAVAWAQEQLGYDSTAARAAVDEQRANLAKFKQDWAQQDETLVDAYQNAGAAGVFNHLAGSFAEMVPQMIPIMKAAKIPTIAGYFGVLGALQASDQSNGDPAATAFGATVGAATGGATQKILTTTLGQKFITDLVNKVTALGAVGAAQTAAAPAVPAIAGTDTYKLPGFKDFFEGIFGQAMTGAAMAGAHALGGRTTSKSNDAATKPPVDPDVAAATSAAMPPPAEAPAQPGAAPAAETAPPPSPTLALPRPDIGNRPPIPDVINVPPEPGQTSRAPGAPPIYERVGSTPGVEPAAAAAVAEELPPAAPISDLQKGPHIDTMPVEQNAPLDQGAAPTVPGQPPSRPPEVQGPPVPPPPEPTRQLPPPGPANRPVAPDVIPMQPEPGQAPARTPGSPPVYERVGPEPVLRPPGTPSPDRFANLRTEPDDTVPGQFVAKNPAGEVVGLGDSPDQAMRMAQQRATEAATAGQLLGEATPGGIKPPETITPTPAPSAGPAEAPVTTVVKEPATVGEALAQAKTTGEKPAIVVERVKRRQAAAKTPAAPSADEQAAARYIQASGEATAKANAAADAKQRELGITEAQMTAARQAQMLGRGSVSPELQAKIDEYHRWTAAQPGQDEAALRQQFGAKKSAVEALYRRLEGKTKEEQQAILHQAAARTTTAEPAAAPAAEGMPMMITQAMKGQLRARGYSADDIRNMTPGQAGEILRSAPAPKAAAATPPEPAQVGPRLMRKAEVEAQTQAAAQRLAEARARPVAPPTEAPTTPARPLRRSAEAAPAPGEPKKTLGDVAGVPRSEQTTAESLASTTTNREEIGRALVRDLLNDPRMTLDKAVEQYGPQTQGRGRPRKSGDLHDYVTQRIGEIEAAKAKDTADVEKVRLMHDYELKEVQKRGDTTSPRLEKLQDQIARIAIRNQADIESLPRLKEIQTELADKLGKNQLEPPRSERYQAAMNKLRGLGTEDRGAMAKATYAAVDTPLRTRVTESDRVGRVDSLHDYLDAIIAHPMAQKLTPHLVELAKRMKELLKGVDVPVMSVETAAKMIHPSVRDAVTGAGAYNPRIGDNGVIVVNPRARRSMTETVIHEGLHAATANYLDDLNTRFESGQKLSNDEQRHLLALRAIMDEIDRTGRAQMRGGMIKSESDLSRLEAAQYATSQRAGHELITQALSDPSAQEWMRRTQASQQLRDTLKSLGYPDTNSESSLWAKFRRLIGNVFKISDNPRSYNLLDTILRPVTEITEAGAARQRELSAINRPDYLGSPDISRFLGARDKPPTDGLPDERARETARPAGELVRDNLDGTPASRVTENLDKVYKKVADARTNLNLVGRLRQFLLNTVMSPEAMADHYSKTGIDINRYVEASKSIEHAINEFYRDTTHGQARRARVEELSGRLDRNGGNNPVNQLLTDITEFGKGVAPRLGRDNFDEANAHLKDPEDLQRARDLETRFQALPPEDRQLYRDTIAHYQEVHDAINKAELTNIVEHAIPELHADPTAMAELQKALQTRQGIQDLIDKPGDSAVAQAMGERLQNHDLLSSIADMWKVGHIEGDYAPARRFGDHIVSWGKDEERGVKMFESRAEAHDFYKQLIAADETDVAFPKQKSQYAAPDALNQRQLKGLDDLLKNNPNLNADQRQAVHDAAVGLYLRNQSQSTASRMGARRMGIKGASTDQGRIMREELRMSANRYGQLTKGVEKAESLAQMGRDIKSMQGEGKDTTQALDVYNALKAREAPVDGDQGSLGSKGARLLSRLAYSTQLLRPAKVVLQSLEDKIRYQAALGARHGYGKAAAALARATLEMAPPGFRAGGKNMYDAVHGQLKASGWDMKQVMADRLSQLRDLTDEDRAAILDRLDRSGAFTHSQARITRQLAQRDGFDASSPNPLRLGHNLMDMFSAGEHAVDVMNRTAGYLAAYRLEKLRNPGLSPEVWGRDADGLIRRVMPSAEGWNMPMLATRQGMLGKFGGTAMQYRIFGSQLYSQMASLAKQAMTHGDPQRMEAAKTLLGMVALNSAAVGLTGNIFGAVVSSALGAYDWVKGEHTQPHNYENDVRRLMTEMWGPEVSTFLARGGLGLAGIDASRNIGLSNMAGIPAVKEFTAKGAAEFATDLLGSGTWGLGANVVAGAHSLLQGDYMKAVDQIAPRTLRDPVRGYRDLTEGLTDSHGNVIQTPEQLGPRLAIGTALGFNMTSDFYDKRNSLFEMQREMREDRSNAMQRAVQGDLSAITEYNSKYPNNRMNYSEVMQARQRARTLAQQPYGVKVSPRQAAAAREATAF